MVKTRIVNATFYQEGFIEIIVGKITLVGENGLASQLEVEDTLPISDARWFRRGKEGYKFFKQSKDDENNAVNSSQVLLAHLNEDVRVLLDPLKKTRRDIEVFIKELGGHSISGEVLYQSQHHPVDSILRYLHDNPFIPIYGPSGIIFDYLMKIEKKTFGSDFRPERIVVNKNSAKSYSYRKEKNHRR